jgi:phospholipase/carboxylesterase
MNNNFMTAGTPVTEAKRAIVMLHGRGSNAEDIIGLADHFDLKETAIYAPQASGNSWYPNSFIAPVSSNQPHLDNALSQIQEVVMEISSTGIQKDQIYFAGFSQGACLCLEFVTRNAAHYGGVIALTGGLIGEKLELSNYKGNFNQTPVLITTGDPDSHVPLSRVNESVKVMEGMGADVNLKVYKGRQHTIQMVEIELAKQLILQHK